MRVGQIVSVPVYGGGIAKRVVSQLFENMALISTEEEYNNAAMEGRVPIGIGYPMDEILCP